MYFDNDISFYLLLVSNGALLAAATIAILRLQHMLKEQRSFWASPTGASLSSEPDKDEFLRAVERRFSDLEDGIGSLSREEKSTTGAHHSVPHENAVRMAKHGATVDDLTRTCGLSDIEARLLMRVHGQQQSVPARVN